MSSYIAIVPLVIAKDESDRDIYIYQDAPVPDNVTDESIKRLLDEGFIGKAATAFTDEVTIPDGDPSDSWTKDQLTAYAASKSIDLGGAKNKPEILAAVTSK